MSEFADTGTRMIDGFKKPESPEFAAMETVMMVSVAPSIDVVLPAFWEMAKDLIWPVTVSGSIDELGRYFD